MNDTTVGETKQCKRCGQDAKVSNIGAALVNFVCDECRLDVSNWEYAHRSGGISITIAAMVREMPHTKELNNDN